MTVRFLQIAVCLFLIDSISPLSQNERATQSITLQAPNGLALNSSGTLFISDIATHQILRLDQSGKLHVVAGTGEAGFSGDGGPAEKARLNSPHDLLFDSSENLLIADSGNHRIRRIDRQGVITTIAGDGKSGKTSYNDPPPSTSLNYPQGLSLDHIGNLLIADTYHHVVRKLDAQGVLTIFAGAVPGYGGDGGPATNAQLSLPMAVAVAPDRSVYISDGGNSRIRRVTPEGRIQTVAGYGPPQDTYGGGFAGEGVPIEKAKLFSATDLKFDATGNLYIVDSGNNRLRAVRDGIITTLAGTGASGMRGDGKAAIEAQLNSPQKVALARDGTIFVSDRANRCIRKIGVSGTIVTLQETR